MGRSFVLAAIATALLLGVPDTSAAEDYRSGFGFEISVPDVWLVLTRGEVSDHANLLLGDEDPEAPSALDAIPAAMRRVVFGRIQRGEIEIFYRNDLDPGSFLDNINVMRQSTKFPGNAAEVAAICKLLPSEFSRVFGRPITMDMCELRDMVGRAALYFQFDGAVEGTKSLQYHINRTARETIVITATIAAANLARSLSEFEAIVASIRFD